MSPVFRHGRLRLYLLKLLDEAPRHGYEVIRLLQDRFMGIYAPSPGTIYPRLARLEEEGLVTHDEADGRKVYRITEKGREELHARLDDLTELEEEITASVRDIAREVTEDVRETVRTLREELSWATREFHAKAHPSPGSTSPGGAARQAGTGEARTRPEAAWAREAAAGEQTTREAADRVHDDDAPAADRARQDPAQAADRAREDAAQTGGRARRDAPQAGDEWARAAAEPPATEDLTGDREQAGSGATGDHTGATGDHTGASGGRERHEEPHGTSGRRAEREWGEWAGWTGWGGWPGAAGHHGWADPDAYRDLERLAKQFSRELRSAAWHAQAVSEDALRDLRGILDETIDRIKDEVFKGKAPGQPGDPDDGPPPAQ
jgi:DNA-binding PadR family transcriptional regulator